MEKQMTNCPNCGGAIAHSYNHKCQYCGTFLHITDRKMQEIKNTEITDVKVEMERYPMSMDWLLRIRGKSIPKSYCWYETTEYGDIISIDDIKPIQYCIRIPYEYWYGYDDNERMKKIIDNVLDGLPEIFKKNPFAEGKIIDCIYDTIYNDNVYRANKLIHSYNK